MIIGLVIDGRITHMNVGYKKILPSYQEMNFDFTEHESTIQHSTSSLSTKL